jgi:scyllo-inositol 2-dehydrogenase (NADP+)
MKKYKNASDIRVGVIGYGGAFNMGRGHLKEMERAGLTPLAVCELDAGRLEVAEADFPGIETYSTVSAMLRRSAVDLITIITPHNTHAKLARQCLAAGRHVVCEKPLAITTADCDAMIADAQRSGVMLSTYHNRHWDGCILSALDHIMKKKRIGQIVRIGARMGSRGLPRDWWRSSRTISGGILYDWGVHLLEYALQLVDSEVVEVSGFAKAGYWAPRTKWRKDTIEDEASAVIRFRNGVWLQLTISAIDSDKKPGTLEITGTEGSYITDPHGYNSGYELRSRQGRSLTVEEGPHRPDEGHRFYENIAAHLAKGAKLVITPQWARRPIHIIELAMQSARLGRTLPARYG